MEKLISGYQPNQVYPNNRLESQLFKQTKFTSGISHLQEINPNVKYIVRDKPDEIKIVKMTPEIAQHFAPISSENSRYFQMSNISVYSSTPHEQADIITKIITFLYSNSGINTDNLNIVDTSSHIGGNLFSLATMGKLVYGVEIDPVHFKMLVNNINLIYPKDRRIKLINDNIINQMELVKKADILMIDAPWGGENYQKNKELQLFYRDDQGDKIYLQDFILNSEVETIFVKVPKNFAFNKFEEKLSEYYYLYEFPVNIEKRNKRGNKVSYYIIVLTTLNTDITGLVENIKNRTFSHLPYRNGLNFEFEGLGQITKETSKEIKVSGEEIKVSGEEIKVSGEEIKVSGEEIKVSGEKEKNFLPLSVPKEKVARVEKIKKVTLGKDKRITKQDHPISADTREKEMIDPKRTNRRIIHRRGPIADANAPVNKNNQSTEQTSVRRKTLEERTILNENKFLPQPSTVKSPLRRRARRRRGAEQPTARPVVQPTTQPVAVKSPLRRRARRRREVRQPNTQPVVQPTPQPVVQPTPQPVVQPTPQPVAVKTPSRRRVRRRREVTQPTPQPVVQPTPQPVVQPTPQPSTVKTPSRRRVRRRREVTQPTIQPIVQPTAQPVVQPTTQNVPKNRPTLSEPMNGKKITKKLMSEKGLQDNSKKKVEIKTKRRRNRRKLGKLQIIDPVEESKMEKKLELKAIPVEKKVGALKIPLTTTTISCQFFDLPLTNLKPNIGDKKKENLDDYIKKLDFTLINTENISRKTSRPNSYSSSQIKAIADRLGLKKKNKKESVYEIRSKLRELGYQIKKITQKN